MGIYGRQWLLQVKIVSFQEQSQPSAGRFQQNKDQTEHQFFLIAVTLGVKCGTILFLLCSFGGFLRNPGQQASTA
jgi:hypothetical protein